jgi:uncharacterized protein
MLRRYVQFIVNRPKQVIAVVAAVTALLAVNIGKIEIILDVDAQIPPEHPLIKVAKRIEKTFGGKYRTVVGVYPKHGTVYTPQILSKIKRITEKIQAIRGVKDTSITSLMSDKVHYIESTPEGVKITQLAEDVPQNDAEMNQLRERALDSPSVVDLLVSKDGTSARIAVDFDDFKEAGGSEGFYLKLEQILEPERDATVDILSVGTASYLYWLMRYTRRISLLFVLAVAMVGFLHYRAFRTLQGMVIPLVTALMGVAWAMGLMGLIKAPLDPWNAMTPILLLAVGAGHSVQILKRYYEEYARIKASNPEWTPEQQNREAVVEATTKVGAVMLTAGAIASLSFASLMTLGTPSIKSFGICVAFGILAALTVEMTFIPAIRVLLKPPTERQAQREREEEFFDPLLKGIANLIRQKKEKWIVGISVALVIFAFFGLTRLKTGDNFSEQFFEANAFMRLFEKHGFMEGFRVGQQRTGIGATIDVLVETDEPEGIKNPDIIRRMDQLAKFISAQHKDIVKVVSIVDLFKVLKRVFDKRDKASEALPESREEIAQFLFLYEMGGTTSDIDRLVDRDRQKAVILAYARSDELGSCKRIMAMINEAGKKIFSGSKARAIVGGSIANLVALDETIVEGKIKNLIQIAVMTTLLTSIVLRSLVGGLLVLLPLGCAALINLGLMGWLGILLSMGTAATSAMAVGIGADYAIYFIFRVREELGRTPDFREAVAIALMTSGKAIAYVATAIAGGYLCLTLSLFKIHVLLGVLVALTMVTSCLGTVAFLASVLVLVRPKFVSKRKN